jgi:hypothetical protein
VKWFAAILLAWAPGLQQKSEPSRTFQQLLAAVANADEARRVATITAFVDSRPASDPDTLKARLLLASNRLRSFALEAAGREFRTVLADVPARDRDLAARAWYGLAQCEELLGRTKKCTAALRRLLRDYRDLRHARFAAASLRRLQNRDALAVGRQAPEFKSRDLTGRLQSSASARGRPLLVVFFAPRDVDSVTRVSRLLRAFRRHGGRGEDAMCFAVERDIGRLRAFLKKQDPDDWSGPVMPCHGAFLDPVLVQFSVQALPDTFLIGPDGTLLLRSPTPAALRRGLDILIVK